MKLPDDLDGKYFCVRQFRSGAALADQAILESVIYETEDSYDEGAKIHKEPSVCHWCYLTQHEA
jgi:hypothetical protein